MDRDYTIVGPGGRELTITGPADATPDQLRAAAEKAFGASPPATEKSGGIAQTLGNIAAGAVRGAGSIGATLLAPVDAAARAVGVQNDFIGRPDRRAAMDAALGGMGAETDSLAYQGGKLGAEVAGTLGVGGALAGGARVAGAAPTVVNALRTSGMSGGNLLSRIGGGAAAGGAAAGLVNPEDAGMGAAIGGALPPALMAAGKAGNALGRAVRGPEVPAALSDAVSTARGAGYVIPPTQASPTLSNRLIEGFSGKLTTAQNASAKNQTVTNRLAAQALGVAEDVPITPDVLKAVRSEAGKAYEAVRGAGVVIPDQTYANAINKIGDEMQGAAKSFPGLKKNEVADLVETMSQPQFDAGDAIDAIRVLRDQADGAFTKGEKGTARAYKAASDALEGALDRHLQASGADGLEAFRAARQRIAKTYSVEKALNATTGTVDARKLAAQLNRGKPLSGELKTAANFANQFPKASQAVEGMGSLPQSSPLDWALGAGMSASTANPLFLLSAAARPAARAAALSPMVQNRLARQPTENALARLLANQDAQQLIYRGAPVLAADR